jgi:tRNA U34 5-carboxymethylaminomethyl modifying enzyme MnmG/GidA
LTRREESSRVFLDTGEAVTIKVMDGLIVDDLVIQGMKAEGYRVMTGRDVFPEVNRDIKDYLIQTGVILE